MFKVLMLACIAQILALIPSGWFLFVAALKLWSDSYGSSMSVSAIALTLFAFTTALLSALVFGYLLLRRFANCKQNLKAGFIAMGIAACALTFLTIQGSSAGVLFVLIYPIYTAIEYSSSKKLVKDSTKNHP